MKINCRSVAQFLPAAYVLMYFLRFSFDEFVASIFSVALGILGVLSIFVFFYLQSKKRSEKVIFFLLLMTAIGIFNVIFSQNDILGSLLQALAYSCTSLAFFCAQMKPRLYKSLVLALCFYFIVHIILGSNPNELFLISQNYVSIILILSLCTYYVACHQSGKLPEIYLSLLVLSICIWAGGRSGVLSAALLSLATMFLFRKLNRTWVVAASLLGVLICAAIFNAEVLNEFYGLERLGRLGLVDVREEINSAYSQRILSSFGDFMVGAPLNEISEISALGGNPHNSYIRLHAQYGAIGFVLLLGITGFGLVRSTISGAYIVVTVVFVSMLRVTSDIGAFHGPFDIIIYYGIFRTLFGGDFEKIRNSTSEGELIMGERP